MQASGPVSRFRLTRGRVALALLVLAFASGTAWAWSTDRVSTDAIQRWLESLGAGAPPLFVGAFVLGALLGLPGLVFVIGGRLAFGPELGLVLGYTGGLAATTVPFALARVVRRGEPITWRPRQKLAARAFELLERHPLRGVIALRLLLWFNPPLSYALALTRVPTRAYIAGCAIAIAPVVVLAVFATGWFV